MQVILSVRFDYGRNATERLDFRPKSNRFGQKRQNHPDKFVTNPNAANLDIFSNICYNTL
jgi:hypothetical protein